MASVVDVKITADGNALDGFVNLSVRQQLSQPHVFEIIFRPDAFDKFSSSAESFALEKAHEYIGKKIKIDVIHLYKNGSKSENTTIFSGVILEVEGVKFQDAYSGAVIFRGSSNDALFIGEHNCRSFTDMGLDDIVQEVKKDYPTNLFEKTLINSRTSETLPYTVQYNESNFEFLSRLAAHYGEWFLVSGNSQLFFGSPPEQKTELTHGKDLHEFSTKMKLGAIDCSYSAFDYYNNEKIESNSKSHNSPTDRYLKESINVSKDVYSNLDNFFYNFAVLKGKSEKQTGNGTKTDKLGRISGLNMARGISENSALVLGGKVQIKGLVDTGQTVKTNDYGEYRIISLSHFCNEAGNYTNQFEAIPACVDNPPLTKPFHFPYCDTQSAVVTDTNDPEGLGRVKVRFFWQDSKAETPWIRVVTPYAGNKKGIFFIPETGEEVLVAFEDNNAENPYVVGSHYNGKNKPDDWKSDKNYKKAIRTNSGHTIEFNDEGGKEEIIIYDKGKVNTVTLSSHGKLMKIECKGDLKINAQNIDITAEKDYTLDVKGKIDITSQKDTAIKATGNVKVKSNQNVNLEAMSNFKAKANVAAEVSGTNLAVKGSATAEISAGAATTVKGAIVKIN